MKAIWERYSKLMFQVTLTVSITQQIYFPQEQKYLHLALIFAYMAFSEMIRFSSRDHAREYRFIASIWICSIVSVFETFTNISMSLIYLGALSYALLETRKLIWSLLKKIRVKALREGLSDRDIKLIGDNPRFINFILYGVLTLLIFAGMYTIVQLILGIIN